MFPHPGALFLVQKNFAAFVVSKELSSIESQQLFSTSAVIRGRLQIYPKRDFKTGILGAASP
jgi:hypothetical protein